VPGERRPKVQFRLEDSTYQQIEEKVFALKAQGTEISPDAYCRALVLSALQQPKQTAVADEIVMRVHRAKHRVAAFLSELLDEHMDAIIVSALGDRKIEQK